MSHTMPRSIRVGAKVWAVECDLASWQAAVTDGEEYWGFCEDRTLQIFIRPSVPAGQQADTLMHEILHAIFSTLGLTGFLAHVEQEHLEEGVIGLLAPMLHSVFVDNPTLGDYLFDPAPAG